MEFLGVFLLEVVHLTFFGLLQLDGTHILASELANIVSDERFLLDECEIFLASAAPLQAQATFIIANNILASCAPIKECSLRSQVIQSKRE
ncbi:hypothetical protein OSB04_014991 [Centaurea solstitialis]|uniref:Secreted protein n=1 Tax=Centaurea solstitialis TaxID=347529 RepID=A0AA38T9B8_9ASTR|nr:hypothetical protein OSB04_014991 [Centaurea solstitialis]